MAARPLPIDAPSPPSSRPRAKHLSLGEGVPQRAAIAGRMVAQALAAAGLSHEGAARAAYVSKSTVSGWTAGDAVSLARLMELGPRFVGALGATLTERAADAPGPGLPVERHGLRVARECGDVARVIEEATLDGAVSPEEAVLIVREIDEAARALDAARRDLLAIMRRAR